jgi:murein L,D-transpeptidase YafK
MVHGSCISIGCYAMTDKKIEEIFALVVSAFKNGQKYFRIHIFPFRMTSENMTSHHHSKWHEFWKNLKQGYDFFEDNGHMPPNVTVKNKRYVFEPLK